MRGFQGALSAIGFGALVGTLIALSIDPAGTGWWVVGALAGGATAYGVYDYRTTLWAIKQVFLSPFYLGFGILRMLVTPGFYKVIGSTMLMTLSMCATGAGLVVIGVSIYAGPLTVFNEATGDWRIFLSLGFGMALFMGVMFGLMAYTQTAEKRDEKLARFSKEMLEMAGFINPFSFFFHELWVGLWAFLKQCAKVVRLIHNDTRSLCFLYGSFGATVGYFFGHLGTGMLQAVAPLLGAAAGMGLAFVVHRLLPQRSAAMAPATVE